MADPDPFDIKDNVCFNPNATEVCTFRIINVSFKNRRNLLSRNRWICIHGP